MNSYHDPIRNKCAVLFQKVVEDEKLARNIEKHIFNHVITKCKDKIIYCSWGNIIFKNIYLAKIRSIYGNLKSDSYIKNPAFKEKVMEGTIPCDQIPLLSAYDIFPENWKDIIENKMKRDKLKYELKPEAMTDMFKCRKCSSRSCSYYEMQTRSADEPMTQFITCLDCGNHWRQ